MLNPTQLDSEKAQSPAIAEARPIVSVAGIGSKPASEPSGAEDGTSRKNMELLIQLRWTAVLGQIATILFVYGGLGIALPLVPMTVVIVVLSVFNLASLIWTRSRVAISNRELLLALIVDVAALTIQLYLSGGASNPFTSLYLLQISLGAVLLDARSVWSLVALGCVCFTGLTVAHRPLAIPHQSFLDSFNLYISGALIGFALNALLIVVFISRINQNLRERDARLAALRQQAAEEDHIVRMGLLASGAAHELGTPLASISVILGDWRRMPAISSNADIVEDISEMEASLQRCKSIVTGILVAAGEVRGEGSSITTVNSFLGEIVQEWRRTRPNANINFRNAFGADLAIASDAALKQVVFNILDNAFEASPDWVWLAAHREADTLILSISDNGPGFTPDILSQLGKPYQSSKAQPGRGLGLFLVFNVVRKLGGYVTAENRTQGGALVTVVLPLEMLAVGDGNA